MHTALRTAVIAAIGLALQTIVTQAYSTFGKWPYSPVVYYFNPQNNDVPEAAAEAALLAGLTAWNDQGGALFRFMYGGRVSDTSLSNDGRNVVLFRNEFNGNAIATTYTWRSGSTIIDADIIFWDGAFRFITEGDACNNAAYIEDIATHEFGHGLGLGHSTDPASTMWPTYPWCSRESRTLAPDDVAGIQSLYGVDGSANTAPVVSISSPASGASFLVSRAITFTGSASDAQDGDLSSAVQWTSSLDGVIGSGPSFTRTLSIGVHTITASVSDSGGLSGSAFATITVTPNILGGTGGSASFVGVDTQTGGNWQGVYGAHGYQLANDGAALPANVVVNRNGAAVWTWAASTSDSRALQQVAAPDRIAATWFGNFDTRLTFNDTVTHRVSIYVLDWDHRGRTQTIQILHPTTFAVLDQRTVSAFDNGQYLVWDVRGAVTIRLMSDAGPNAVYSALFIDPVSTPPPSSAATFVATDLATQGTWKSTYGADGYSLANDGTSLPSYVTVTRTGGAPWTWSASTADVRALEKVDSSDRIAATWFGDFDTQLDFTDTSSHRVAVYLVDYDNRGRTQTVEILDTATSAVLDQRTLSDFAGGVYLVWDLKGAVTLRVRRIGGPNAVYSALFFGTGANPPPAGTTASFVGADATTQGTWRGSYGSSGYSLVNDLTSLPPYATLNVANGRTWTWVASTFDVRALQKAAASDRLAATWFETTVEMTVDLTDGQAHQISLYFVDWDANARSQIVQVLDASTMALLDTRAIDSFSSGVYLTWMMQGRILIRIIQTGPSNAIVSGVFFDQ